MRGVLVLLHRWLGLATAAFLFLAGTTGAVIAFHHELDEALNPRFYRAPAIGAPLAVDELIARVERTRPALRVTGIELTREPGRAVALRMAPRSGDDAAPGFGEAFVDPVDGAILAQRRWGACCFSREQLVPFLYSLHASLHLPGRVGVLLLGCVAFAWTIDCVVALALTFPRGRRAWRRWPRALRVGAQASRHRLLHDLHQAAGLWLWPLLLALAVSGVAMTLGDEVFRPVVSAFSPLTPTPIESARRAHLAPGPASSSFGAAIAAATRLAEARGWPSEPVYAFHASEIGAFGIGLAPPGADPEVGLGASWLYLSDGDLRLISADVVGEGSAGDAFLRLQFPLHSGHLAGVPGRVAVAVTGLATAGLAATGVALWAAKRAARQRARVRGRSRSSSEAPESPSDRAEAIHADA